VKLHRIELTGFGPFRERQTVDFDAFDDDGVFLISGRTGAGKSSILDGVSFALYGSVPRYDGGERRLRSDHCALGDPTEVRLEFTTGQRRLRVTRAPEYDRPAKRGGGLTTEPQRAELEELQGEVWVGLAAKPREVALLLDEVLGVNAQQFQQVILLAQNKFSRFLLATAAERQTLLRTLFGTRRFEQYRDDLDTRRKEAQRALETSGEHARTLLEVAERLIAQQDLGTGETPDDLPARREAASVALQRAEYRVDTRTRERSQADAAAASAETALADATAQRDRLVALAAAREELATLQEEAPRVEADGRRLALAQAAEAVRAPIEATGRAREARDAAMSDDRVARDAWLAAGGAEDDRLEAVIERLTGEIALWEEAAARERELDAQAEALADLEESLALRVHQLTELDAQQAQVPAERDRMEEALARARVRAERRDDARAQYDAVRDRMAGAVAAASLAEETARAEAAYAEANEAAAAAVVAVTDLLRRRLAGHAGELAAELVAGQPCAVCGSPEHPHPADLDPEPVTDGDLAAAEARRDRAAETAAAAGDAARVARTSLADANARAGGQDVAALEPLVAAAEEELRAVEAAAAEVVARERQRDELDALAAAARTERDRLAAQVAEDRDRVTASSTTVAALRAQLDEARGTHDSVASRVAEAVALRERARDRVAARERLAERERAYAEAARDRDERVAATDFSSAEEATAALIGGEERSALDRRVAEHGRALGIVKARLLELELQVVDRQELDLDAVRRARDEADAARASSIAAESDAKAAAERLRELVLQIDDAYARVAEVAEQTAVVTRLADSVAGRAPNTMKMDLETFVLAAELEEIVAAANVRLGEMSSGRYTLHHSDAKASHGRASGLGIDVLDAHTARLRSPQSLSGGESFLASLALALGLAEVVTNRAGGLRLDTLFIDEGFGSLDPETLDLAMRTLDELRAGGRTVGIISHVEAMKEQLHAQLVVETTGEGPSVIRQ
jgi:exonuclease SbcC